MVANHMSTLDILVMYRLFRHFKWVSKIENFSVPFIGWNMSLNRCELLPACRSITMMAPKEEDKGPCLVLSAPACREKW